MKSRDNISKGSWKDRTDLHTVQTTTGTYCYLSFTASNLRYRLTVRTVLLQALRRRSGSTRSDIICEPIYPLTIGVDRRPQMRTLPGLRHRPRPSLGTSHRGERVYLEWRRDRPARLSVLSVHQRSRYLRKAAVRSFVSGLGTRETVTQVSGDAVVDCRNSVRTRTVSRLSDQFPRATGETVKDGHRTYSVPDEWNDSCRRADSRTVSTGCPGGAGKSHTTGI